MTPCVGTVSRAPVRTAPSSILAVCGVGRGGEQQGELLSLDSVSQSPSQGKVTGTHICSMSPARVIQVRCTDPLFPCACLLDETISSHIVVAATIF